MITGSGVLVSNYGGNAAYALFYGTLILPVVALFYTFYVYIRFRLYQEIGQRTVVKGDLTPYTFTIANEDYITFCSVKVNFLCDKSQIVHSLARQEYCLLPNTKETLETHLRCNFRGEYYVGAQSVEIVDFLYIFKITYPISSKLKVTVLPRIVSLKKIGFAPVQKDAKTQTFQLYKGMDAMDIESRKYQPGDEKKQIHWKITARRGEIYSRKLSPEPKEETTVFLDLSAIRKEELEKLFIEDMILESVLAIANYYRENNNMVRIVYWQGGLQQTMIAGKGDFNHFYHVCNSFCFNTDYPIEALVQDSLLYPDSGFHIIITHKLTEELYKTILLAAEKGKSMALVLIADNKELREDIIEGLLRHHIPVRVVLQEDNLEEVLAW
jgi:uncharacterized protein (DUF58 family)